MNTKAKGSRNEYKSRDILIACGYSVCKAGGSLGEWDLVGVSPGGVALCQVKSNGWPGSVEMETLENFRGPPNCVKLVHRWDDRQPVKVRIL